MLNSLTDLSDLVIIFFIFLYLVFDINNLLQGRTAKLYYKVKVTNNRNYRYITRAVSSFQGEQVWTLKVRLTLFQELGAVNLKDFFPTLATGN